MAAHLVPGLDFEGEAWSAGATWVAGVDEVGVGPLAGPVTAAAVAMRRDQACEWYEHVRDSKVLGAAARDTLAAQIRDSVPWAVGWATNQEIDRIGILPARRLCMLRAIEGLGVQPDAVISDALPLPLERVRAVIDGDALCVSVAAASIIAKVARDALMEELDAQYPGWGFARAEGAVPGRRAPAAPAGAVGPTPFFIAVPTRLLPSSPCHGERSPAHRSLR
ncbi:MAG: ribonuclease HII [Dehalococcoidia bacterium]|nr:ribonuclease HII [Dehalococcoidia bacterium]